MTDYNISDPSNITGLSSLLDPRYLKRDVNVFEVEKNIIANNIGANDDVNHKDIDDIMKLLLNDDEMIDDKKNNNSFSNSSSSSSSSSSNRNNIDIDDKIVDNSDDSDVNLDLDVDVSSDSDGGDDDKLLGSFKSNIPHHNTPHNTSYNTPNNTSYNPSYNTQHMTSIRPDYSNSQLPYQRSDIHTKNNNKILLNEHEKHKRVASVMENIVTSDNHNGLVVSKNYEQDNKYIWLDEIDTLKECIKSVNNTKVDHLQNVNVNSSIEDIYHIHQLLLYKYNSMNNWSIIEDVAIACTDTIEWFLDGKSTYFGKKPNATGISRTTSLKLKKLRFKAAKAMTNVVGTSELGFVPTLMMELCPALIMQIKTNNTDDDNVLENSLTNINNHDD